MTNAIDKIKNNDNRKYDYSKFPESERVEYDSVINLIEPNSNVVDLGCGNGTLLKRIISEKKANGKGVEISPSGVETCKNKGLDVIKSAIDAELPFEENQFDYSICNVTIQMVTYPEMLLKEMKRISKYQIISFPNFAFYKNRIDLFFKGRMPNPLLFGYTWYNTGHIHQLSIRDFYRLLNDVGGIKILRLDYPDVKNSLKNLLMKKFPNMFVPLPIFLLKKN